MKPEYNRGRDRGFQEGIGNPGLKFSTGKSGMHCFALWERWEFSFYWESGMEPPIHPPNQILCLKFDFLLDTKMTNSLPSLLPAVEPFCAVLLAFRGSNGLSPLECSFVELFSSKSSDVSSKIDPDSWRFSVFFFSSLAFFVSKGCRDRSHRYSRENWKKCQDGSVKSSMCNFWGLNETRLKSETGKQLLFIERVVWHVRLPVSAPWRWTNLTRPFSSGYNILLALIRQPRLF